MTGFPDLRQALARNPQGTAVEFGVASGLSTRLIAAQMPVIGFDSFQGLPEDWRPGYPKGSMAFPMPTIDNARLIEGWFADTLPGFEWPDDIGLVHIDCDLYTSTTTALQHVGPHLKPGCLIVLDDYHPGDPHVYKAFHEAVEAHGWNVKQQSDCFFTLESIS